MRRIQAGLGLLALAIGGTTLTAGGVAAQATPAPAPTFERVVGGPGHAGMYAWGMATMRDGSILIGDYWNYRVLRYSASGTPVGSGVFIKNNGHGATQYYTPYGLAVDPRNGNVVIADTDKAQVDVYNEAGKYVRSWGSQGSGPGKYKYPSRVAVGSDGRIYVVDTRDHNIVVTTETGTEIREIGGKGSAPGKILGPHGISLDAQDNVYVVDSGNKRISVFDKNGNFLRKFGSQGSANGQFRGDLRGLAVDKARGWVYVVDGEGNRIHKFDLMGNFITRWGSNGHGNGQFADGGREVTVDARGNVWVADMPNYRVQKFSPTGSFLAAYPNPAQPPAPGGFNAPRGVAVNPVDGRIAVSDTYNWRIETFTNAGSFIKEWGERGRGDYEFNYTRLIAFSPKTQDIIVTDTDNGRIKAFSKDGVFRWSSGERGGALGKFGYPHGVAVAGDGTIYVADSLNSRVQVLNSSGKALRAFGTKAQLGYPRGIAVDPSDGSIWVADSAKDKITNWTPTGTLKKTLPIPAGTADNALGGPFGIVADATRLYVADTPAHKVKMFSKAGNFLGSIGSRGSAPGKLIQPDGLALYNGRLYVADEGNDRISVFKL